MRNIVKRTAIVLGGSILLALLGGVALHRVGLGKLIRSYPNLPIEAIKLSSDTEAVARTVPVGFQFCAHSCTDRG